MSFVTDSYRSCPDASAAPGDLFDPTNHGANERGIRVRAVPYARTKRCLDFLVAAVVVMGTSPLLLLIALLIKATSRGPVLFRQTRIGLGGEPFTLYKFRSMCADAERLRADLVHLNEVSGPVFKIRNDPRVTRVGRILRRYSLDELPQLWNVIRGDMTLVGPRPPLASEVEQYTERELGRLAVKPGLTCLWQVSGRSTVSFDRWIELDLMYIETMSLAMDISILLRTVPAVVTGRGAQ